MKDEIEITGFDDLSCIDVLRTIKLLNNNKYREALKVGESSDNLVWLPCSNVAIITFRRSLIIWNKKLHIALCPL